MTAFSRKYYRSLEPLVMPHSQSRPIDWAALFGRQAPMELEIGFGNGEYLNRLSLAETERDFVGLELAWASVKRALRRLAAPPRPNVRVMQAPAQAALRLFFAPESLEIIRALFPIPWPEEKHAGKRIFHKDFLDLAASRLTADGRFLLVTDSRELADWTLEQAEDSALSFEMEERGQVMDTKYERKWHGAGQEVFFHLSGRKKRQPLIDVPEESPMQAYYSQTFDPKNYHPENTAGDVVVKFREFVFDQEKECGLLRTLIIEGPLTQEFFIRISRHENGWKFSPAIPAQLIPTAAVAVALELAAGLR